MKLPNLTKFRKQLNEATTDENRESIERTLKAIGVYEKLFNENDRVWMKRVYHEKIVAIFLRGTKNFLI
jgi:hypothetical protein